MPADPLSDTLGLMDSRCVVSGGFTAGGDWALRFPRPEMLKITVVVKGGMYVALEGAAEAVRLEPGDAAVFDGSRGFVVASDPAVEPADATRLFADTPGSMIHYGGERRSPSSAATSNWAGRARSSSCTPCRRCCTSVPGRRRRPCCAGCSTSSCTN